MTVTEIYPNTTRKFRIDSEDSAMPPIHVTLGSERVDIATTGGALGMSLDAALDLAVLLWRHRMSPKLPDATGTTTPEPHEPPA